MFWSKNKKKYVYPCKPQFYYIKVGCKGVYITRTCFPDVFDNFGAWSESQKIPLLATGFIKGEWRLYLNTKTWNTGISLLWYIYNNVTFSRSILHTTFLISNRFQVCDELNS